ncbi:sigma-70 family RNA polymerase sigma factor [Leucobacter coleopterorum]|uniref:Sigma-70 family RNA polymerase sigma factor n=1 Tax=Leucobacter coleopterorum TaxID=2714933 RepID=A0ABX6JYN7_9MICO|nr:sigma-70 family RNA polymerase sigma factor [Leucobacter coleopterorum]QIM17885.1 sigma-70 family RNA polymerase sigma factor [Leucobacter coleopterorum]
MAEHDSRSDAELTDAYRNGDQQAAAELYRRYYLKLLRGIAAKLPSFEIAEDCVGEAFLNVLEIIRGGSGPTSNFYGYLRSAVTREGAKYFRERELGPSLDKISEDGGPQPYSDDDLSHIDESLLTPALRSLPARWRELLTMRYIEMLKPAQIATMLGTDAPTLHKVLYRAKKGLHNEYLKQVALSRSSRNCRDYANDLATIAISGREPATGGSLNEHLARCSECQTTLKEVEHQSHRARPDALGLALLIGGVLGGSAVTIGGESGEARALADGSYAHSPAKIGALPSAAKAASVNGMFQTLGVGGTLTIVTLLIASLVGAGLLFASGLPSSNQAEQKTANLEQSQDADERTQKVVRTDDGKCELEITVADGTLVIDAAVHSGKCWFSYHAVGDELGEEEPLSTGWMIVTRIPGEYAFELRSTTGSKQGTVTLY